jgi:hypothetical protein
VSLPSAGNEAQWAIRGNSGHVKEAEQRKLAGQQEENLLSLQPESVPYDVKKQLRVALGRACGVCDCYIRLAYWASVGHKRRRFVGEVAKLGQE